MRAAADLLDFADDAMLLLNEKDGRAIWGNRAAARLIGAPAESLEPPAGEVWSRMADRLRRSGVATMPMALPRPAGPATPARMCLRRRRPPCEGLVLARIEPVTADVPALDEAPWSGAQFATIVFDAHGGVVRASASFEEMTGLVPGWLRDPSSAAMRSRRPLLRQDGSPMPVEELPSRIALRDRRPSRGSVVGVILADGAVRWLRADAEPVFDHDRAFAGVVLNLCDASALVEGARDAEDRATRAEAADAAKSERLATASHEFRTPLNGVTGMLSLMLAGELPPAQRARAEVAHRSAVSLIRLADDLVDLSRLEARRGLEFARAPYSPVRVCEEVCDLLHTRAEEKGLALEVEETADAPERAMGDAERVRQILLNLVGNALKFTEAGGVTLRVGRTAGGEALLVEVRDTGVGIAPDRLSSLFDRYTCAPGRDGGGAGLGLAISRELAEAMGGAMTAESAPGAGSRFRLTLPLAATAEG